MSSGADAQIRDFRSWWNVDVSKDISKDLSAGFKLGQRLRNNSLEFDRSLATLSLGYDLPKGFDIEGGYRYILLKDDENIFQSRYRIHGDVSYRYSLDRLRFGFRERMQYGFDDLNSIDEYFFDKLTSRSRISVKYDIFGSPFSLQGAYEIFVNLNAQTGVTVTDHRIRAGFELAISQRMELDIYYLLDQEVNRRSPLQSHIFLVTMGYNL